MKKYSKEFLIRLYTTMVKIRLCEESFVEPIFYGKIKCPVHLYSGEEAIAAGICAALTHEDYVFGNHRSHGHYLAMGGDLDALVAEIFGKETGCARGRGGSMHVLDPEKGMTGAAPIVAGTISLALGAALAIKIRNEEKVAVSFFGDGAAGEGVLYESLNFAALHCLPILFVCENNHYATHMPITECRPHNDIYKIGEATGIQSHKIDGNNVLDVYEMAVKAASLCKKGKGPVLIECTTYRQRGHVGPDDNIQGTHTDIRPKDEIEKWKQRDPIKHFEAYLIENTGIDPDNIEKIRYQTEKEIESAHLFAKNSQTIDQSELGKYVFK
jgi:pyruvate dehydrogenase E1 component alpha subunit